MNPITSHGICALKGLSAQTVELEEVNLIGKDATENSVLLAKTNS
jgi:hypothetical protein